jgi:lysine 2,3-aminomutase
MNQELPTKETNSSSIPEAQWKDWKWHLRNSIRNVEQFERITGICFDQETKLELEKTLSWFPMAVTPYYASLIDTDRAINDPVFLQCFPSRQELYIENFEMDDPLHEEADSPIPCITHRYPDRVLLLVSNHCSMYCRHCTRKRRVGDIDQSINIGLIHQAIGYIREHNEIRDVLLSGGDPLMLDDHMLEAILIELKAIPHIEIIRIGTRMPVVLPYRITDELTAMLKKYHPLWINTQYNHPRELTKASKKAISKLADAGIPLGNQSVLLAGINDCPTIIKTLSHELVKQRVRPYYLYQCDLSPGLSHFRTPVGKGIEIMECLVGHTSGLCVPTFVIDAPGGGGKIPVMPHYIISWSDHKVILRNYEGLITTYQEPDRYESKHCDTQCSECINLSVDDRSEDKLIGIEKLLSDQNQTITLSPADNERMKRREDENG